MAYAQCITDGSTIRVSAGYPYYPSGGVHGGIDTIHTNGLIYAPRAGTVAFAQTWNGSTQGAQSWGNCIRVRMDDGQIWLAAHMAEQIWHVGDVIEQGQYIGVQGSTGYATGVHTHWELWTSNVGTAARTDPSVILGIPNAVGTYEVYWDASGAPDPGSVLSLNPPPGTYETEELIVTISGISGTGNVWLTADGTNPRTSETRFLYTGPIRYWDGTYTLWVYDTNSDTDIGPYTYTIVNPRKSKLPVWLLFQFD